MNFTLESRSSEEQYLTTEPRERVRSIIIVLEKKT